MATEEPKRKLTGMGRELVVDSVTSRVSQSFTDFRVTDEKYMPKPIDLNREREEMNAFKKYLQEDRTAEKASRGLGYVLWKRPCGYAAATEAFRINAYDEREGAAKLDRIRSERDRLRVEYRQLMAQTVALEAKKISYKRFLRYKNYEPRVVARSSGHPGNSYVYGYGYTYGVGYTDNDRPMTAPGFELTATEHVKRVVKTFSPAIGQGDFDKLYREIFATDGCNPQRNSHKKHGTLFETTCSEPYLQRKHHTSYTADTDSLINI